MIKRDELSAPMCVFLNVTNRCNLQCRHCSASAGSPLDDELTTDEWLAFIKRLAELKVFQAIITGGEPLARPDILELMEELDRRRIVMKLNTNATLMDEELAGRLGRLKLLKSIAVSLDGSCAAIHDRLRGAGAFDKAVRGIEVLVRERQAVSISTVVTKLNVQDLEKMVLLAQRLGAGGIAFGNLRPAGRTLESMREVWLGPKERKEVAQRLADLEAAHCGFVHSAFTSWHRLLSAPPRLADRAHPILVCSAGQDSCAICADGRVLACNLALDYVCGNIRDQDLGHIWLHSPKMQAVRDLAKHTVEDVEGCRDCAYRFTCTSGCRADSWIATGSWVGGPAPTCWFRESAW